MNRFALTFGEYERKQSIANKIPGFFSVELEIVLNIIYLWLISTLNLFRVNTKFSSYQNVIVVIIHRNWKFSMTHESVEAARISFESFHWIRFRNERTCVSLLSLQHSFISRYVRRRNFGVSKGTFTAYKEWLLLLISHDVWTFPSWFFGILLIGDFFIVSLFVGDLI